MASIQIVESVGKFKSELTKEEEEKALSGERNEICDFIIQTIKKIEKAMVE